MKVLIISSSLRDGSNSQALADAFAEGASDAGHITEKITLKGKDIRFCIGCLSCQKNGRCFIDDDAQEIVRKMHDADVLAFASPIYYFGISGQLKTLLDRANPLYGGDYHFRSVYLLLTAAEDSESTPEKAVECIRGWVDCFERASLASTIFAGGVNERNEISGHEALGYAYSTARAIAQ